LTKYFEPLLAPYEEVQEGVHYASAMGDSAEGERLDVLFDEDHPDVFSDRLVGRARVSLLQAIVDSIDEPDPQSGWLGRQVDTLWTRPNRELWAGADEDYFDSPSYRWREFVRDIKRNQRFARGSDDSGVDPSSYLTEAVLQELTIRLRKSSTLYRAVLGGARDDDGDIVPHPVDRMKGPKPEHCRRGGRVNPAGIPVLYTASRIDTAIAEVRPWKGALVSVATAIPVKSLRLVDFAPHRKHKKRTKTSEKYVEGLFEVLSSIGGAMAEPVNPDDTEIDYVPTQYVADLVKSKGFDGIRYSSAVANGYNIALFSLESVAIQRVGVHVVNSVHYGAREILPPPRVDDDMVDFDLPEGVAARALDADGF